MKLTDITTDIRVDISFNVPNSVKSAKLIVVSNLRLVQGLLAEKIDVFYRKPVFEVSDQD